MHSLYDAALSYYLCSLFICSRAEIIMHLCQVVGGELVVTASLHQISQDLEHLQHKLPGHSTGYKPARIVLKQYFAKASPKGTRLRVTRHYSHKQIILLFSHPGVLGFV